MADQPNDISKWAGVGMAFLAAAGGYVGSVSSKAGAEGAMNQKVETLQTAIERHDANDRAFEDATRTKLSDIDARVRVLESKK